TRARRGHGAATAPTGRSMSTLVPAPEGSAAVMRTVPRRAATRSRMFASPPFAVDDVDVDDDAAAEAIAPRPHPSSLIETRSRPSDRASATDARLARACFAVLARASRTT